MYTDELFHYGTPQRFDNDPQGSGRFRQGSGEHPYQHGGGLRANVSELKKQGLTEKEIAEGYGMTIRELRQEISVERAAEVEARRAQAIRLKDKGYSNVAAAKKMGIPESTYRSLLKPVENDRAQQLKVTSDILRDSVDKKGYIDIGAGVELEMNVKRTKFDAAVKQLVNEGYTIHKVQVDQLGSIGNKTTIKVLAPPGTQWKDVANNMDKIRTVTEYISDDGKTRLGLEAPKSISSDRVQIRYAEDGGVDKDGVIELRRGVEDISLGDSRYAQVRIAVDGTHYLKGMAVYSDDMPKGVDVIFNTNKSKDVAKLDVMKPMKTLKDGSIDPDNPFGATIKPQGQRHYIDKDGKDQLGCVNIVYEEGDWGGWKKSLASQMLSKQDKGLIRKQLALAYEKRANEFNDISNLTNPSVKRKLLESFADSCDSDAVHLKAAALPRQASQVILPLTTIKDNEIFAPNYRNGEEVVLIRYPHGGIFEIPRLKVNNNNKEGQRILTNNARDAVGINSHVAERLSGADFDGDTVLVIPVNDKVKINTAPPLTGLKNFDPKEQYKGYEGMKVISSAQKQREMGVVSNLITDMTLKGATSDEIARAVRHSMVVIDAEKHKLDWKRSYEENRIGELKKLYQDNGDGKYGASTLISRAKSEERVPQRSAYFHVDPETGKKIYQETGRTYKKVKRDKDGNIKRDKDGNAIISVEPKMTKSTKMAETDDAYSLSSGTVKEALYADYANKLKALSNRARKEAISTKTTPYSKTARDVYSKEVASLYSKLNVAKKNAPRERQAQLLANSVVKEKRRENPDMDKDDIKKCRVQALNTARDRMGSSSRKERDIQITPREWEAIQAGAVNKTMLDDILKNTDLDVIKQLATPRDIPTMTQAKINRAKSMASAGYTNSQIADILGVSTSTVSKAINS